MALGMVQMTKTEKFNCIITYIYLWTGLFSVLSQFLILFYLFFLKIFISVPKYGIWKNCLYYSNFVSEFVLVAELKSNGLFDGHPCWQWESWCRVKLSSVQSERRRISRRPYHAIAWTHCHWWLPRSSMQSDVRLPPRPHRTPWRQHSWN